MIECLSVVQSTRITKTKGGLLILSTAAIGKDAGDLALKPTTVETFFYGMKPRYPAGRGYELYQNQRLGQAICAFNSYVILRMSCSS